MFSQRYASSVSSLYQETSRETGLAVVTSPELTCLAASSTLIMLLGTSSFIRHSNAATGTGPFGRTSTV